jgi:hypothetical protein
MQNGQELLIGCSTAAYAKEVAESKDGIKWYAVYADVAGFEIK